MARSIVRTKTVTSVQDYTHLGNARAETEERTTLVPVFSCSNTSFPI
ncbi:hypothetical protein [Maribacter sp. 2-571]